MESACAGLDLVNSERWFTLGAGRDRLEREPRWLARFLRRWELPALVPTARQRRELLRLRSVLCAVVEAVATGERVPTRELADLNGFLAAHRPRLVEVEGGFELLAEPAREDWTWVLSEIAGSVADLLADGEPERLKLCENPECRWAFYDLGRNRRRRWCDPGVCGNRDRVRRFRARHAAG